MGRLVQGITEFHADVGEDDDIEEFIFKANMPLYQELADENARERGLARVAAKEKSEDGEVYACPLESPQPPTAICARRLRRPCRGRTGEIHKLLLHHVVLGRLAYADLASINHCIDIQDLYDILTDTV